MGMTDISREGHYKKLNALFKNLNDNNASNKNIYMADYLTRETTPPPGSHQYLSPEAKIRIHIDILNTLIAIHSSDDENKAVLDAMKTTIFPLVSMTFINDIIENHILSAKSLLLNNDDLSVKYAMLQIASPLGIEPDTLTQHFSTLDQYIDCMHPPYANNKQAKDPKQFEQLTLNLLAIAA